MHDNGLRLQIYIIPGPEQFREFATSSSVQRVFSSVVVNKTNKEDTGTISSY
jgi:hypothetical protein